jgi:hypothetical protein
MLSPEDYLAEKTRTGKILVSVGVAFPQLANQPYLVVTAKMPAETARYFRRVKSPSSGIAEGGKIDAEGVQNTDR